MEKTMSIELKNCLGAITHSSQGANCNPKLLYRAYQLLLNENYGLLPPQRMLERAASLNYGPACIDLAMLYYNGRYLNDDFESVQDEHKMAQWLQLAADRGNPQACLLMARCYCTGIGVPKSEELAYRYVNRISEEALREFFNQDSNWSKRAYLDEIKIIPAQILYLQTLGRRNTKK